MPANDPALAADLLHTRLDLHDYLLCHSNQRLGSGVTPRSGHDGFCRLLVAVDDPAATQVIRAQLDDHPVVGQDPDIVHPHLAADMSKNLVPVVELHSEKGIGQRFDYRALNLDGAVFLGHILRASLLLTFVSVLVVPVLVVPGTGWLSRCRLVGRWLSRWPPRASWRQYRSRCRSHHSTS